MYQNYGGPFEYQIFGKTISVPFLLSYLVSTWFPSRLPLWSLLWSSELETVNNFLEFVLQLLIIPPISQIPDSSYLTHIIMYMQAQNIY